MHGQQGVDMDMRNGPVIEVLKQALAREQQKMIAAELEIFKIKMELRRLGVELPLGD